MKIRYLPFLLLFAIFLTGCGSGTYTQTGTSTIERIEKTESEINLADMMEIQEYSCTVDNSFMYYILYVTNDSDTTVSIEMNVTALDSSGNMVGSSSDGTKAVEPGQTAGIWTTFDEWNKIESFDYTLTVSEETDYSPIYSDLAIDYNTTDSGVIVSVSNNSDNTAEFVWIDVVYLKNGKMVNFSELSFMDGNQQLLPGVTLSAEGTCYSDSGFDEVILAVNGRR